MQFYIELYIYLFLVGWSNGNLPGSFPVVAGSNPAPATFYLRENSSMVE